MKRIIALVSLVMIITINVTDSITVKANWFDDLTSWVSDTGEIIINDINKATDFVEQSFYAVCDGVGVFIDNAGQAGSNLFDRGVLGTMLIAAGAYTQEQLNDMSNDEIRDAANSYVLNGFRVVDGKVVIPDSFVDISIQHIKTVIDANEYYYYLKTYTPETIVLIKYYEPYYLDLYNENIVDIIKYGTKGFALYGRSLTSGKITSKTGASVVDKTEKFMSGKNYILDKNDIFIYDGLEYMGKERYYFSNGLSDSKSYLMTVDGRYIRIFKSSAKMTEWVMLNGRQNIYYKDSVINYDYSTDNSMTINKETFVSNNWKEVNNNYYNVINENVTSENLEELMNDVKEMLQELLDKESAPVTPEPTPTEPGEEEEGGILGVIIKIISELIGGIVDSITSVLGGVIDVVTSVVDGLLEGIEMIFTKLFKPSDGLFDNLKSSIEIKMPFIAQISDIVYPLYNVELAESKSRNVGQEFKFNLYGVDVEIIDFSAFDDYLPLIHAIILAVCWWRFAVRMYKKIPNIIKG